MHTSDLLSDLLQPVSIRAVRRGFDDACDIRILQRLERQ
jgi:hypothetical protein